MIGEGDLVLNSSGRICVVVRVIPSENRAWGIWSDSAESAIERRKNAKSSEMRPLSRGGELGFANYRKITLLKKNVIRSCVMGGENSSEELAQWLG